MATGRPARELFAADAIWNWEVPEGRTVSHGLEQAARNVRAFLDQWGTERR